MTKSKAKLIELYHTLPASSLRTLLDHTTVVRDRNGSPVAGTIDLARAHDVLTCWLTQAEKELGLDNLRKTGQNEIHRAQAMIGTCPVCDQNDGVVVVGGQPWTVCHAHFTRWKTHKDFLEWHEEQGFSVVHADEPGVLRYSEIDYPFAKSLAPSRLESAWDRLSLAVRYAWFWLTLPFDLVKAIFRRPTAHSRP